MVTFLDPHWGPWANWSVEIGQLKENGLVHTVREGEGGVN